jgi:hypothetical protein
MSTTKNNNPFENYNWDSEMLPEGHEKRFLKKLKNKKTKKQTFWKPLAIASCFLLGLGFLHVTNFVSIINQSTNQVRFSPEVKETHDYFSAAINQELHNLKQKETPKNKVLIEDALQEMEILEKDYENLKQEIKKNGENKQIVFALITNMQTRIDFIKAVLNQVDTINKLNHENSL